MEDGKIELDDFQISLIEKLEARIEEIDRPKKIFSFKKNKNIKSLYVNGEVGRGNTFIMDLFFDNLKTKKKISLK